MLDFLDDNGDNETYDAVGSDWVVPTEQAPDSSKSLEKTWSRSNNKMKTLRHENIKK